MSCDKLCCMKDKSCGSCCYDDISEVDKQELIEIFRFRRQCFKVFLHGRHDVAGYEFEISKRENIVTIETDDVNGVACAYLGFSNDQETRVGCLAHPEMNQGKDLRNHGFYKSAKLCENFYCKAAELYQTLTSQEKELFRILLSNWTWYEMSDQGSLLSLMRNFLKVKDIIALKLKTEEVQLKDVSELNRLLEKSLVEVGVGL